MGDDEGVVHPPEHRYLVRRIQELLNDNAELGLEITRLREALASREAAYGKVKAHWVLREEQVLAKVAAERAAREKAEAEVDELRYRSGMGGEEW